MFTTELSVINNIPFLTIASMGSRPTPKQGPPRHLPELAWYKAPCVSKVFKRYQTRGDGTMGLSRGLVLNANQKVYFFLMT